MPDRICETFSAPTVHRIDAILKPSELLGPRALTVYAAALAASYTDGHFAECGVAGGHTAAGLAKLIRIVKRPRLLYLFDTFGTCPIDARNNLAAQTVATHACSVDEVLAVVDTDKAGEPVVATPGLFRDTLPAFDQPLAFVHADGDLYESTCDIIAMCDRLVAVGGVVVFDDYGTEWTGVTRAVDERLDTARWVTYAVAGYGQLVAVRRI